MTEEIKYIIKERLKEERKKVYDYIREYLKGYININSESLEYIIAKYEHEEEENG